MEATIDKARQERGLQIARNSKIVETPVGYKVPSQTGIGTYIVKLGDEPFCSCPDFEARHLPCKHIHAVEYITKKVEMPDGTVITTEAIRVTYNQDWSLYNAAQTHEQEHFVKLLKDLCNSIENPEYEFGRPRLPLSDVVFGLVMKSYSNLSGRRFETALKAIKDDGFIDKAASYNSSFRYLEKPELTEILKNLIELSATPLKAIETDFAVDSSGFATSTYSRWFDHKYGREMAHHTWVKTHLMCGVNTHIVTSVEATPYESGDAIHFPKLVNKTAETFAISEVSADKAYSSKTNLNTVAMQGGIPYIPFKKFNKGSQGHHSRYSDLWQNMWHFYMFNRDQFLQHYHKRSNVETVFSMIKMKFGSHVRSKLPVAQVNEVLCKILCHNICVLIQSMYELNIVPMFSTFEAQITVAQKVSENCDF